MSQVASKIPQSHFEELSQLEQGYWWFEGRVHWATFLAKKFLRGERCNYLDIGAGTGGFAKRLGKALPQGERALIENDPDALSYLRSQTETPVYSIDLSKPFAFPFTPDLVTCMDVIEHLKDDVGVLKEIHHQLPSETTLIISVPAMPSLFSEWDRKLGHFRRYTMTSLGETFAEAGFEVEWMRYMWSFLTPVGYYRKRYPPKGLEFPKTSKWINQSLILSSRLERWFPGFIAPPMGTSLIAVVRPR